MTHAVRFLAAAALFHCLSAHALPFFSFDPRSMAMGGAGVAVANPGTAPFFNPALLAVASLDDDFSLQLPIIGARYYNPDAFIESLDRFLDEDHIGLVEEAIDELNSNGQIPAEAGLSADRILDLSNALLNLSKRRLQVEAGGGLVVGIPSRRYGAALSVGGWVASAGLLTYKDAELVSRYTDALYTFANSPGRLIDTADLLIALGDQNDDGEIDDPTAEMQSELSFEGIIMSEVGLSLAREIGVMGHWFAVGIQPKMVTAVVFDYHESIASGVNKTIPTFSEISNIYSSFNLDIGAAMDYDNGWRTGVVIRNLLVHHYTAPNGARVSIEPQVRLGISKREAWYLLALDVDITTNAPIAYEEPSHYIALGAELYYLRWGALRMGYRINTTDSARNVASFGFDIGTALDVAYSYNQYETGASLQLGFSF